MYKEKKLSNGLRVITAPVPGTKTVTVLAMVATGSKYENRKNNGISHFLEHMFFKGTKNRPTTLDIAGELDAVGAEYNAFTDKECTGYWVKTSQDKKELALDVVSDILMNSKFSQKEIERERGVIMEEKNMYHNNPMMRIDDLFEECLYGDTPAGWEIVGTKKNIQNLKRADFLDYFKNQYGAENTILCLAGNVSHEEANKLAGKHFKNLRKANPRGKEKVRDDKQKEAKIKIEHKEGGQVDLSLGVRAYPLGDPREYALKMLGVILGGSMSSRLFIQLRERHGLAYSIHTESVFYSDSGYLTTEAGVPKNRLKQAIQIILQEYEKIKKEGVSEEELQKTKDLIKGKTVIQLESSDRVANWYARQATFREEIIDWKDFLKKIDKIKVEDIKKVAEEVFDNSRLNLALVGPFKNKEDLGIDLSLT